MYPPKGTVRFTISREKIRSFAAYLDGPLDREDEVIDITLNVFKVNKRGLTIIDARPS